MLCIGKRGVHRAANGRPDAVAAHEHITGRRAAILELEDDGFCRGRGLLIAGETFVEMNDFVSGLDMIEEDLLKLRSMECMYLKRICLAV